MDDDGRQPIAIGHLSESGDLKKLGTVLKTMVPSKSLNKLKQQKRETKGLNYKRLLYSHCILLPKLDTFTK